MLCSEKLNNSLDRTYNRELYLVQDNHNSPFCDILEILNEKITP